LQLLPADAVGRAAARLLIQRFSDKFVPAFYKLLVLQVRHCVALCHIFRRVCQLSSMCALLSAVAAAPQHMQHLRFAYQLASTSCYSILHASRSNVLKR
jgi:hypothetical protein